MNRFTGVRNVALLVIVVSLLAGCGGSMMIRAEQDLKPGSDAALIVFLRPNHFLGQDFALWDREHFIGQIDAATSVSYRARPGEHMFLIRGENWEVLKGRVQAGRTYHVWVDPRVGVMGTRVSVQVLDPNDKKVSQFTQLCTPMEVGNAAKREAYEKKHASNVSKAINNVDSGKSNFIKL